MDDPLGDPIGSPRAALAPSCSIHSSQPVNNEHIVTHHALCTARLSYHCHIKARHAEADGGETMGKLVHGYINATGVFPQAEDVIDEMGAFILEKLGVPRH